MFENLSVRSKFLAAGAVPTNLLVVITVWAGAVLGSPAIAAVAALGALATMLAAHHLGSSTARRVDQLTERLETLDIDAELDDASSAGDATAAGELGRLDAAVRGLTAKAGASARHRDAASRERMLTLATGLSNKNRELLDQQIDHIDWLEATEENPDRLEHLFELDHLATQMRRACERIAILTGPPSLHDRDNPAPVADVVRVAVGENAAYRNIELNTLDEVMIESRAACELTHLLSELLANATGNSPDESPVELHATHLDDGCYRITIIDRGAGMADDALAAGNAVVADPPPSDQVSPEAIGLLVAGKLARHLGATIELSPTAGSGVTAEVVVPADLVIPPDAAPSSSTPRSADAVVDPGHPSSSRGVGAWIAPTPPPAAGNPALGGRNEEPLVPAGVGASAADAVPAADAAGATTGNESGLDRLLGRVATPLGGAGPDDWTPPVAAARAADELGLVRRQRSSDGGPKPAGPLARASTRKPDEVRSMITKYRDALKGGGRPGAGDER